MWLVSTDRLLWPTVSLDDEPWLAAAAAAGFLVAPLELFGVVIDELDDKEDEEEDDDDEEEEDEEEEDEDDVELVVDDESELELFKGCARGAGCCVWTAGKVVEAAAAAATAAASRAACCWPELALKLLPLALFI